VNSRLRLLRHQRSMKKSPLIPSLALALLAVTACERGPETSSDGGSNPDSSNPTSLASPKKLTTDELASLAADPDFFFIDVRSAEEISTLGTLPGYVHIPIEELQDRLGEIPPGKVVVTA